MGSFLASGTSTVITVPQRVNIGNNLYVFVFKKMTTKVLDAAW